MENVDTFRFPASAFGFKSQTVLFLEFLARVVKLESLFEVEPQAAKKP